MAAVTLFNPAAVKVGPGILSIAAIGSPEPTSGSSVLDVSFVPLGYTDSGSVFTAEYTTGDINVAETLDPILIADTARTYTMAFSLAEITAKHLQAAHGGGVIGSPTTGYVKFDPPALGTRQPVMLVWEALDDSERLLMRSCLATGSIAIPRQKAPNKALIPVTYRLQQPTNAALQPFSHWFNAATQA